MKLIDDLKKANRLNESFFIAALILFCFSLSVFRVIYSKSPAFVFLNWNLFLAFIPWVLTSLVVISPAIKKSKVTLSLLLVSWLLFFPNAPYILTDLFHLRDRLSMPIWFDLVLILSFAWTGLLLGFLSLWDIEAIILKSIKRRYVFIISSLLLFIGSFGIYIGRYLRWNSWDIITDPLNLIYDIGGRIIYPFENPRAWGMTIAMGIFLNIVYWSFHLVKKR